MLSPPVVPFGVVFPMYAYANGWQKCYMHATVVDPYPWPAKLPDRAWRRSLAGIMAQPALYARGLNAVGPNCISPGGGNWLAFLTNTTLTVVFWAWPLHALLQSIFVLCAELNMEGGGLRG